MAHHLPILDSAYPPSRTTVRGQAMVLVAGGFDDRDEVVEQLTDWVDEADTFFPDDPEDVAPAQVEDIVDAVTAEHNRLVLDPSTDALALQAVLEECYGRGIAPMWCGTENGFDAVMDAQDLAEVMAKEGITLRGVVIATYDDVAAMLTDGQLSLGVQTLEETDNAPLVTEVADLLADHGLHVAARDPQGSVTLEPVRFEMPFPAHGEIDEL